MNGKVASGDISATTEARIAQLKDTMPFVETLSNGGVWNPTDVMPLTSINGVPIAMLPDQLDKHCDQWLSSNRQERGQVLHGLFPLGMVQRWIERAEQAEAKLRENAT
jgi:hypothetical protein